MIYSRTFLFLTLMAVVPATAHAQRIDSTRVTLRITSTSPGQEVTFKGAFLVDDSAGVQLVMRGITPFEIFGNTASAHALIEKLAGSGQLEVSLTRSAAPDSATAAMASGPRLSVQNSLRPQVARQF